MREILDHTEAIEEKTRFPRSFYWATGILLLFQILANLMMADDLGLYNGLSNYTGDRVMVHSASTYIIVTIAFLAAPAAYILMLFRYRIGWMITVTALAYYWLYVMIHWIRVAYYGVGNESTLLIAIVLLSMIIYYFARSKTRALFSVNKRQLKLTFGAGVTLTILTWLLVDVYVDWYA